MNIAAVVSGIIIVVVGVITVIIGVAVGVSLTAAAVTGIAGSVPGVPGISGSVPGVTGISGSVPGVPCQFTNRCWTQFKHSTKDSTVEQILASWTIEFLCHGSHLAGTPTECTCIDCELNNVIIDFEICTVRKVTVSWTVLHFPLQCGPFVCQ